MNCVFVSDIAAAVNLSVNLTGLGWRRGGMIARRRVGWGLISSGKLNCSLRINQRAKETRYSCRHISRLAVAERSNPTITFLCMQSVNIISKYQTNSFIIFSLKSDIYLDSIINLISTRSDTQGHCCTLDLFYLCLLPNI